MGNAQSTKVKELLSFTSETVFDTVILGRAR